MEVTERKALERSVAEQSRAASAGARRGIFMILWGKNAFKKVVLEPGQSITVGRTDRADLIVEDGQMSGLHFSVWFSGKRAVVRDLDTSTGTAINGQRAERGLVDHGGFIVAGTTTFQLFLEGFTEPLEDDPTAGQLARAAALKAQLLAWSGPLEEGELYAVLDAARHVKIRWMLQESIDDHANLYEGFDGRVLDDVAPYLVRFKPGSQLLDRLLLGGWGDAWGIFLRTTESPKQVRRHLRRFLMVQDEETLERLYFRFYDPRVLSDFSAVITPRQRSELLHAVEIAHESNQSPDAELVRFSDAPIAAGDA